MDRLNLAAQMAAGISHEVRNPITTVRGFLQLLQNRQEFAKDSSYFTLMIGELDRASDILSNFFLSLIRIQEQDMVDYSLNTAFEAVTPLLKAAALIEGMELLFSLHPVPPKKLHVNEIQQFLITKT